MLVERGQVLETLSGMLAEVANGDGRLVFLGGEAGIGKTSVAAALLASVPAPFVVRRGACDNLTTPAALGPIAEALPEIGTDLAVDRAAALRDRQTNGLPVPRGPRAASRRNSWGLTPREIEILELLTDGLSNTELARQLYLSEKTVGHHVSAILRKLGEPTRSRAVAAARKHGIVAPT